MRRLLKAKVFEAIVHDLHAVISPQRQELPTSEVIEEHSSVLAALVALRVDRAHDSVREGRRR